MDVEALTIVIATGIAVAWLAIVFGWLCTCKQGDETGNNRNVDTLSETPASKDKPAA
jgi:hypothetical protein